jgi:hypothetical protein
MPELAVASSPRAAGAMCDAAAALDPCVPSPHDFLATILCASIHITECKGDSILCLTIRGSHLSVASDLKLCVQTIDQRK